MKDIEHKGLPAWFVKNHVAANLLMILIIAGGLLSIFRLKREVFPEFSLDIITVTVLYLGASPDEVEQGVCIRVEEAVAAVDGIKRMHSTASEGVGLITIEVEQYADVKQVRDEVEAEVDRIITFPEETEKPIIREITTRNPVLTIVAYGDVSEQTLRELAGNIRDDLTAMENISQVDIKGVRPYEISIEISEETLRRHGLTFDELSRVIGGSSLDIPGGSVKTTTGEVLIRAKGQRYIGREFEKIVVLTRDDGSEIRLGDIAEVKDDFEDADISAQFNGKKAVFLKVYRVGDQSTLDIAETVFDYISEKEHSLPEGITLGTWDERSDLLKSRMDLLARNGYSGLILVFLCLAIFMDIRLAFWTVLGIPISFLGAFWLMPVLGISINMISLFAFIMALGIVVDDAIVIGENVFNYRLAGYNRIDAAIAGVREMAIPVSMAVLTTIIAFVPLIFIEGVMGKIMRVIPFVVISILLVSLCEAMFILPAHLSGMKERKNFIWRFIERGHKKVVTSLDGFVNGPFAEFAMFSIRWRYVTFAGSCGIFIITMGLIQGGYIKFTFFDPVEADNMVATLTMPQGTPADQTKKILDRLEQAAEQVRREYGNDGADPIIKNIATILGDQPTMRESGPPGTEESAAASMGHIGEVNVELLGGEIRTVSATTLKNRWREIVGEIPGISSLNYYSEIFTPGEDINFELSHKEYRQLLQAAEDLKSILRNYSGVTDIADSFEEGKAEIKISLTDAGRTLGLTLSDLARQARQGFYGEEVQRIQRGRDDVRVMLRYPERQRKSIADVENMRIRAGGAEIPFGTVADVDYGRGYASIERADRRRVVNVTANVDETAANAAEINREIQQTVMPDLKPRYPGLNYRLAGAERERDEAFSSLRLTFPLALLGIYAVLAIQFKSYIQPVIVMSAIPFGIVGATIGHVLMGYNLGLLSFLGIVALSGIVVNDSLIMIDLINHERGEGTVINDVIRNSVTRRFRPIILTTLTTFLGLMPLLLEKSLQARFLIPMAISLGFGVVFATLITLLLVPSLYMILEDFHRFKAWIGRDD